MSEIKEIYKTVTGKFDGQHVVTASGSIYLINPNYASKSKLLEGDELKVIIYTDGDIVYKQVARCQSTSFLGKVVVVGDKVLIEDMNTRKRYSVLGSTVTYFHLVDGVIVKAITVPGGEYAQVELVVASEDEDREL